MAVLVHFRNGKEVLVPIATEAKFVAGTQNGEPNILRVTTKNWEVVAEFLEDEVLGWQDAEEQEK